MPLYRHKTKTTTRRIVLPKGRGSIRYTSTVRYRVRVR